MSYPVSEFVTDLKLWLSANWQIVAGAVAVIAPTTAAAVSVFNSWREHRSLEISLLPDQFQHVEMNKQFAFTLRIANPGKSTNSIKEWNLLVSGQPEVKPDTVPPDLLKNSIPSGEWTTGQFLVPLPYLFNNKTIGFRLTPVRGRRRTFTFTKQELLGILGLPPERFPRYSDYERIL